MAKVVVKDKDIILATHIKIASSFLDRLIGLMFSKKMFGFDCLFIKQCRSIHTCFMRYPIDVVFITKDLKVVRIIKNMKPWKFTRLYFTAAHVLELRGDSIDDRLEVGDQLEVICIR